MAIVKNIRRRTIIVPVRFARAPDANNPDIDSGPPDANAPDPDDRGFVPAQPGAASLPVGLDESLAEAARPETRVRLIREDMENGGALFITVSDNAILAITSPAPGTALPGQQNMMIRFRARAAGECLIRVMFGAENGPVIHQLRVVVNALRDVRIAAHVPTINGAIVNDSTGTPVPARSTRTDANIRDLIAQANAIYFPYGIRFVLDAAINRAGVLNFSNRGMVNDMTNEFGLTTANNRVNGAVNMYFVPQIGSAAEVDQVGGSASSSRENPNTFGSLIADMAAGGQTIAHELGHVLNLVNDPRGQFVHVNTVNDPASPGTGREVRSDIVSRRRLMWAFTNLPADPNMPYRSDVGYGAGQPGAMLTVKQLDQDRTDLEMREVQRAAARLNALAGP